MYVRTISRKNKDGSVVEYVQLAHNYRDPKSGFARAEVIHSFGRKDQLDVAAIKRLVKSLCRFLSPQDALHAQAMAGQNGDSVRFVGSKPAGGIFVLRKLWDRLGIGSCIKKALNDRRFTAPVEQALFAMVANRALAPDSKLAVEQWVKSDVFFQGADSIEVQHLYRAMDFLVEHQEAVQKEVFWSVANLLNLEVDIVFFDTTSTYFETDTEDEQGLRRYGHSKDKRTDLPQVVIGLAVTKQGLPIRSWVFAGNTADSTTVDQIQRELGGWKLGRVVWVMDRGMTSEHNRVVLQRAGGHYILGEKLRSRSPVNKEALSHRGRFTQVHDNLRVKEAIIGDGAGRRRFVIVYNPQQAGKDQAARQRLVERIESSLEALGELQGQKHTKAVCTLRAYPQLSRYVKELKSGKLAVNRSAIKAEEKLDGKYLLSSSDDTLTAQEVALGYKQLLEVERAFRTLKTTLELRPVYHRKDERIQSHVTLCWLALLLVRIAELETGLTWERIRTTLSRIHVGEFFINNSRVLQRSELTQDQYRILKSLKITPPPPVTHIDMIP
jgi:transposase